MARTTPDAVKGIIDVEVEIELTPFIDAASSVVTDVATGVNGPTIPYIFEKLELIERWVAAHFYTVRDPRTESEKTGQGAGKFRGKTELGFTSSLYGQQAMMIDTNGGLARLNRKILRKATVAEGVIPAFLWLGTELKTTDVRRRVFC